MTASSDLKALAADIEDVLMRFRGNPDDAETLRRVTTDLLSMSESDRTSRREDLWVTPDRRRDQRIQLHLAEDHLRIARRHLQHALDADDGPAMEFVYEMIGHEANYLMELLRDTEDGD